MKKNLKLTGNCKKYENPTSGKVLKDQDKVQTKLK
jgi:hypothetical protein